MHEKFFCWNKLLIDSENGGKPLVIVCHFFRTNHKCNQLEYTEVIHIQQQIIYSIVHINYIWFSVVVFVILSMKLHWNYMHKTYIFEWQSALGFYVEQNTDRMRRLTQGCPKVGRQRRRRRRRSVSQRHRTALAHTLSIYFLLCVWLIF